MHILYIHRDAYYTQTNMDTYKHTGMCTYGYVGTGWVEMGSYSTLVAVGIWTLQRQGYSIFHSGWECTDLVHNLEEQVAYLCIPLGDTIRAQSWTGSPALFCS